jgi:hypothetical protein
VNGVRPGLDLRRRWHDADGRQRVALTVDVVLATVRGRVAVLLGKGRGAARGSMGSARRLVLPGEDLGAPQPASSPRRRASTSPAVGTSSSYVPTALPTIAIAVSVATWRARPPRRCRGPARRCSVLAVDWLPQRLAFDHDRSADGLERIRASQYTTLAGTFVDEPSPSLTSAMLHEAVWGVTLDPGTSPARCSAPPGSSYRPGPVRLRLPWRRPATGPYRRGPAAPCTRRSSARRRGAGGATRWDRPMPAASPARRCAVGSRQVRASVTKDRQM